MNNKTAIRVIACILAVLMILGGAFTLFTVIANAEDLPAEVQVVEDENIGGDEIVSTDASLAENTKYNEFLPHIDVCHTPIRVGIFYIYSTNNCLAFSHNIFSENGLIFYSKQDDNYSFFHSSDKPVTIMRDFSAAKNSSGKYYHTTSGNTHIIYHCITAEPVEPTLLDGTIENYKALLPENTVVFPFYISGKPHIAVGTYPDKEASQLDTINVSTLLGTNFVARVPNNTCISVIETDTGKILFKIDTADCRLFVRPIGNKDGTDAYIKSSVGNIFDGTFEYKATIDGMYLVNILDLDDYIKSVLPYEIFPSSPIETLKAFSLIVRSYTLSNLSNNHKNQDFDMCDETHCQVYRGRLRSNENTDGAVEYTSNLVLAYDSKICKTFYHAVAGGMTEAPENVWYSSYPYLKPKPLPFEKYWEYQNGVWSNTVSKSELFSYLENNSTVAAKITGSITDVRISEYTPSGYAYKLEITDSNGNVAVFEKAEKIQLILLKYVKSPRISIGKVSTIPINDDQSELDVMNFYQTDKDGNPVRFNASGESATPQYKTVLTANGEVKLEPKNEMITISGTGWGHGVGMSQYGAIDMAELGYDWKEIATYFFEGAYIADLDDLSCPADEEREKPPEETTLPDEEENKEQDKEPDIIPDEKDNEENEHISFQGDPVII